MALRERADDKKPSQNRIESAVQTLAELGIIRAESGKYKNSTCLYVNEEEE